MDVTVAHTWMDVIRQIRVLLMEKGGVLIAESMSQTTCVVNKDEEPYQGGMN